MTRPIVIRKRPGRTLSADRRRAPLFEAQARAAIAALLAETPEHDRPGLSRAIVQESIVADAGLRGAHEAASWAQARSRHVETGAGLTGPVATAEAKFRAVLG